VFSYLLFSGPALAGLTLVIQGGGDETTIYADGENVRVEHPATHGGNSAILLDAAAKKAVFVNDKDRTYSELGEADRQRMRERARSLSQKVHERLSAMQPQQRARVEEMMAREAGKPPWLAEARAETRFEAVGVNRIVNGFACQVYRRMQGRTVREELCLSPWDTGPVRRGDVATLRDFAAGLRAAVGGRGPGGTRDMFAELDVYPGLPILRAVIGLDGRRTSEQQIKSIKRGAIPNAKFAVPAGYAKLEPTIEPPTSIPR
jgi:hypothetical protein